MPVLTKKNCIVLVVLILLVILGTTLGVLYGVGVIGLKASHHSGSSGSSGGNSGGNSGGGSGGSSNSMSDLEIKKK